MRTAEIALVAVVAMACGAGAAPTAVSTESGGIYEVTLTVVAQQQDRQLHINGATNLPDGALLDYEVTSSGGADPFNVAGGTTAVRAGAYSAVVDLNDWSSGDLNVWVAFQAGLTEDQPTSVLEQYGRTGERLTGSNVSAIGEFRRVEREIIVRVRGQ